MPAFVPRWLARFGRYTVMILAGLALLWGAAWKGWIFPSDRQYRPRPVNPADITVPKGYRVEVLASGLNAPSALEITPDGQIYIGESGYGGAYAATAGYEGTTEGRVLRLERDGTLTVVAGGFQPPLSGFFHAPDGNLFVSHRGMITVVTGTGQEEILTGLPSWGDHKNNNLAMGPDGKVYFLQGTVTNSGVVGLDNWVLWGRFFPGLRDVPCKDVKLKGINQTTADPRSFIPFMRVRTGAFSPFGHSSEPGQVVKGELPCNGALMRMNPDGSGLELVAWGMRNPFDLRWGPDGQLYVTDNGFDTRGSRPIDGDDLFYRVLPGAWYGWPDYWNGQPVTELKSAGREKPELLLAEKPAPRAEKAFAAFEHHAAAAGFDFAPARFGFAGEAFVAQWGNAFPATYQEPDLHGFDVVRLNLKTGQSEVFARNKRPGPASLYDGSGGFERPVMVRFGPDGAMYVLDWGFLDVTRKGPYHVPHGGVLWRISREGTATLPHTYAPPPAPVVPVRLPDLRPLLGVGMLGSAAWLVWRRKRLVER